MHHTVVFDACVLYPAPLRDLLLRLAISGLFSAKWTEHIQDEWIRNLLESRPELRDRLSRTRELMNSAIPDVMVTGYEPLIENLNLPDAGDRNETMIYSNHLIMVRPRMLSHIQLFQHPRWGREINV